MRANKLRNSTKLLAGIAVLVATGAVTHACPPTYTISFIPSGWGNAFLPEWTIQAHAINESGTVAGSSGISGFKWDEKNGTVLVTRLPGEPGFASGVCFAINNDGWVAGRSDPIGGSSNPQEQFPTAWSPDGQAHLMTQGGLTIDRGGRVAGMSDSGVLVGRKNLPSSLGELAVTWQTYSSFPEAFTGCSGPGSIYAQDVFDVNDNGRYVGRTYPCPLDGSSNMQASYRDGPTGRATAMGVLAGDVTSAATAVNNAGAVIGYSAADLEMQSARAFIWTGKGDLAMLGSIPGGPPESYAHAISENGEVVGGTALTPTGVAWRWTSAHGMADLNTLLESPSKEWAVVEARGVNAAGQIAVTLRRISDGAIRAARLDPVRGCAADFNCDELVNSQDFFDFLTAFFNAAPSADFNRDQAVNSQDFFDFVAFFFDGC